MRIAVLAHHVAPIAPPFIGGVESHTWYLTRWLAEQGHDVTLYALPGSEVPGARLRPLDLDLTAISGAARADVSTMPPPFVAAHHAYLDALLELASRDDLDAIHVNTLHYLPVAMAATLPVRPLLTLHCPPTPWLESALTLARRTGPLALDVVAVSSSLAATWHHAVGAVDVIPNGIDLATWAPGTGGGDCVWAGRIVPEKAPHVAIDAARAAGRTIRLAGPMVDEAYFRREVEPRLGPDADYVGHLGHEALQRLMAEATVTVQAPAWDEPFGLTAAESIACGTPVAALRRGGLVDVIGAQGGVIADGPGADALAVAIDRAATLDRHAVRAHAETTLGVDAMAAAYEARLRAAQPTSALALAADAAWRRWPTRTRVPAGRRPVLLPLQTQGHSDR